MDGFTGRVAAPAKVNLYLHVDAVRADSRHPLDSLVVFSGDQACDWLTFQPADEAHLAVEGARAGDAGPVEDNLVLRALDALAYLAPGLQPHAITLDKRLPVAAGLGGGSSDAGAVLRTLGPIAGVDEAQLLDLAAALGGDIPACVLGSACRMQGDGDRVTALADFPGLPALLVNPGVACPTGPVFRAFDAVPPSHAFAEPALPDFTSLSAAQIADWLASDTRNNLEAPACALVPEIAVVLETLQDLPKARLVRMSGSGASCFALFDDTASAAAAHDELERLRPDWWAKAVVLR